MLPKGETPLSDPNAGGPLVTPEDRPTASVEPPRSQRPLLVRLLPLLIVVVALGGFGGIVGYYYFASSSGSVEGMAPLVRADQRPVRVRPDNPGGMDVPHQDKEIYNKVAGRTPPPQAERLLPPPETPLPRPAPPQTAAAPADPATVLDQSGPVAPGTLAASPPRPAGAPPPTHPNVPPPPDVAPPADIASQRTIPPPPPGSTALPGAPAPRAAAPASPAPPQAVVSGSGPVAPGSLGTAPARAAGPAAQQQAAAAPRVAGGSRVVLASLQSEADARREWERLRRQHGDALANLTADFVRTDLGARGVFWRIYVGPVESGPDAQGRCAALKQRGVNCFVARP